MKRKFSLSIALLVILSFCSNGCAQFEADVERKNPFDVVFDSGDLRMVLNFPKKDDSSDGYKFEWSNVFHKSESLSDENFSTSNVSLYAFTGVPDEAAIEKIKKQEIDGLAKTSVKDIPNAKEGSHIINPIPAGITTYFITGNYTFKPSSEVSKSGVFHSNLVVVDRASL